jgi:hypothetical protein
MKHRDHATRTITTTTTTTTTTTLTAAIKRGKRGGRGCERQRCHHRDRRHTCVPPTELLDNDKRRSGITSSCPRCASSSRLRGLRWTCHISRLSLLSTPTSMACLPSRRSQTLPSVRGLRHPPLLFPPLPSFPLPMTLPPACDFCCADECTRLSLPRRSVWSQVEGIYAPRIPSPDAGILHP